MIGHRLGLRLFLEGIETPVVGASVTIIQDSPSAASIQIIATNKVFDLLPRTLVHLFFLDFIEASAASRDLEDDPMHEFDKYYKLLFVGEVQGIVFQKDSGSRSVILQCVDLSNYWDTTYQYNFGGSLLFGHRQAAFIGANTNLLSGPLAHGVGLFARLLSSKCVNFPDLEGLLAGIVHCLEAIGGCYYGRNTFKGANYFTSIAELRLKLLQQITAAEKDKSTARLFARKTFYMWLNRQMGSLGKLVTFRGVVQILQSFIYHSIFPCPVSLYQPEGIPEKKFGMVSSSIENDPKSKKFVEDIKKLRKLLASANANINRFEESFSAVQDNPIAPIYFLTPFQNDIIASRKIIQNVSMNVPKIPGLNSEVQAISEDLRKIGNIAGYPIVFMENLEQTKNRISIHMKLTDAISACDVILGARVKHKKEYLYTKQSRLNTQILRPDLWFCAPPRCNVLFPEMYQSFQWQRNFLREVSRLELQTTNEILGDQALFNGRYYAPDVTGMRNGLRLSSRQFGKIILDHELFTGIIPMFEKLTEANLFAMRSKKVNYGGAKVSYAQRAVNHQYFKHRFSSRSMTASGRFNPWFAPGFPAVLIDKPMTPDKLVISTMKVEEAFRVLGIEPQPEIRGVGVLWRQLIDNQFFGCCVQLQHNVSQEGGSTSYVFEQARVHRESTEFMGVDKKTVNKVIGSSKRTSIVPYQSSHIPKKGGKGPYGGKIINNPIDVTQAYANRFIPVVPGQNLNTVYITYPKTEDSWTVWKITEEYIRREKTEVDLPIEDAIRPPWFWDGWTNIKIGQTYMQFFGTDAITDIDEYRLMDTSTIEETEATTSSNEGVEDGNMIALQAGSKFAERIAEKFQAGPLAKNTAINESSKKDAMKKVTASAMLAIEEDRTIEASVDYLVRIYSFIKTYGLDVGEFIRNYTWRPVATLPQILGSHDWVLSENLMRGDEGFHSRAFGNVSDLFGLVDANVSSILGISKGLEHATAKKMDVRGRRYQAVLEYVEEVTSKKGLLG